MGWIQCPKREDIMHRRFFGRWMHKGRPQHHPAFFLSCNYGDGGFLWQCGCPVLPEGSFIRQLDKFTVEHIMNHLYRPLNHQP